MADLNDTSSPVNPFGSIFWQNNPNVNKELRQRIALAMLTKKNTAPKTFGEGLSAIGDAFAERSIMKQLEQSDLSAQATGKAEYDKFAPPATAPAAAPPSSSYAPPEDDSPASSAPPADATSSATPAARSPAPGSLPPTGEPGNTGATTFPPPFQPTPEDPRRATALSMLKQGQPGQPQEAAFAPAKPSMPALPELPAMSGQAEPAAEEPRRAIALAMLKQGQTGQPQGSAFAPAAGAPPPVMAFDGQPTPAQAPAMTLAPTQGIQPAPPPQAALPQQQAPQQQAPQQQYPPGYVIPEPGAMPQRRIIPPSQREQELFRAYNTSQNEYAKPALAALLKQETDNRTQRQAEVDKVFEHQLGLRGDQSKKRWDQQADQAKRQADIAHTNVQTGTARAKEVNGKTLIWGDDGRYHQPEIVGQDPNAAPTGKLNEYQGKTVKFLKEMYLANEQLKGKESILADGYKDAMVGKVPFAGNALMERHYRMAKNVAETWVAAQLRDISGAVVGTEEHAKRMKLMMPQPGDDPAEIKRKAIVRQTIMDGMKQSLGDQSEHADYAHKQVMQGIKENQTRLDEQMKNVPKDGRIYKNPANPKERRIWDQNDKVWREI